ncbi:hypothetical protein ACM1RC_27520 [Paenibacillus azoreducens]|uniref:hypothetical protein n=1 Tax=Paenibacillus azoreducens TaxID=116718 RepID=UPI0039F5396D
MNQNEIRRMMALALQKERRLLAEHKHIEALDARAEYRKYRRELTGTWGDGDLIQPREAAPA